MSTHTRGTAPRGLRVRFTVLALILATMALVPATAGASTVAISGNMLVYGADNGEANNLRISLGLGFVVSDPGASIDAVLPCVRIGANARCPSLGINEFGIALGDRDDSVNTSATSDNIADLYSGGDGTDTVSYSAATVRVIADPDLPTAPNDPTTIPADDGRAGEGDTIAPDVENIIGGAGNDRLLGLAAPVVPQLPGNNVLSGRGGRDSLSGLAGNDRLKANRGSDTLDGGPGTDTATYDQAAGGVSASLQAGSAPDDGDGASDTLVGIENLIGSDSGDELTGQAGIDNVIDALAGNDDVNVRGGPGDRADCGPGTDSVIADTTDSVSSDCESVQLFPLFPPAPGQPGAPGAPGARGGECAGKRATIVGTDRKDVIDGTPGRDVIVAFGGKDTVRGGKGKDLICGAKGADRLLGNAGADTLIGGAKGDDLFGGGGRDLLKGKKGQDFLNGGKKGDQLRGGKGEDRCKSGAGNDQVSGCEQ